MKIPAWIGLMVLFAFSCRKLPVAEKTPPESHPSVNRGAAPVRVGAPSAATSAADDGPSENPRTGPLPRPEDPKHKPAPPLPEPAPTAAAVKGKPGFIFSPFNNKIIDVRDLPPGTLVADPTYPSEEKKYFRVP